uniref:Uncharacterized protein n=1 Tax=Arundo donax TaxID=35708 RepID=A0A0A9A8U3_ARUDO
MTCLQSCCRTSDFILPDMPFKSPCDAQEICFQPSLPSYFGFPTHPCQNICGLHCHVLG